LADTKRKVLILCTGNSCRSQMAEAFINRELGDEWQAFSAGVKPSRLNRRAVQVMAELGIDISGQHTKSLGEFLTLRDLDLVITVCDQARDSCPVFPGNTEQVHIAFDDPAPCTEESDEVALPVFRRVRDEIRGKLLDFLKNRKIRN
jgi:arsenate reductase